MKRSVKIFLISIIFLVLGLSNLNLAEDWERIITLKGSWKFSIGDDPDWAKTDFDDSKWETVYVPSPWEDEGFYGYNGFAWYRKQFEIPQNLESGVVYLFLGYIDDVDETFINGHPVGASGSFPPDYKTAYNAYRRYPVPLSYLKKNGLNTIAVRVYDQRISGGIISGDIGLYTIKSLNTAVNLEGIWKFNIGDDEKWSKKDFNDSEWGEIIVPANWETQGYEDYDGYAWYRKYFSVPEKYKNEKWVLALGKIDDYDEVYLNGKLIGSTGNLYEAPNINFARGYHNEWQAFRGYYILDNNLNYDKPNVIAVRVYDGYLGGGIYQGPIGLIPQSEWVKYWKGKKEKKSIWDLIFGD